MILKFQQGGSASLPPLVSYDPVIMNDTSAKATAAAEKNSSADLTDKDLMKMLEKLDGLPSDMQTLTTMLQNFYIDEKYGNSINTSSISSRYLSALNQMKVANFNKKEYDNAFSKVSTNGGLNEYAISDRGQLVCANSEGDFKLLTIDQLKDNDGYSPLTNSELLQMRAYNPKLAYNTNILKLVENGVGMKTINELINQLLSSLGSNENSNTGYAKTKQGELIKGLEDFMEAQKQSTGTYNATTEDLYKAKLLTKDQAIQAEAAFDYIFSTLPVNAKTLLQIKSDGTEKGARQLIGKLISSKVSATKQFDVDLEGGKTAKQNAKDNGKITDNTDLKTSLELNVMKGIGGYDQPMMIDPGNGIQMSVVGTYYQQIKTPAGKPIVDTSLKTMLADSGLQSIIKDVHNITFGDQKVSMDQLGNITYNNTGLIRADLPINEDGSVRLDILQKFEQAQEELRGVDDLNQRKAILDKYDLSDLYNDDGSMNRDKFGAFMVTEGYTTEKNGIKDSSFVKKLKDPSDQEIDLIKRSLTTGTGKNTKVPSIDTFDWYNPFDWFGVEDIYKAAIYIPISNNVNSAVYGANQKLDYDEAVQQETKYRNFNKKANNTSADVL